MGKLVFVVLLFLCVVGLGGVVLFNLGLFPQTVYSFSYPLDLNIPPYTAIASFPYLEKFEGYWYMTLTPSTAESDIASCSAYTGLVGVHNGVVEGAIGSFGDSVSVEANVLQDGTFSGAFNTQGDHGVMTGMIEGASGNGTWSDTEDCTGTVTFAKLDPITDPVVGNVLSMSRGVTVIRNGVGTQTFPSESLYASDLLQVPKNGFLSISLGSRGQQVVVPAGSTYEVPAQ